MAIKNVFQSDITGVDLKDDERVRVVVKGHPKLDEGKQLDAAESELHGLKAVNNLVTVELQMPNGSTKELAVTATELEKVIPLSVLQKADGLRGRRPNYKPGSNLIRSIQGEKP